MRTLLRGVSRSFWSRLWLMLSLIPHLAAARAPSIQVIVDDLGSLPVLTHLSIQGEETVDGSLYLFGGLRGVGDPVRAHAEVWRFDLSALSWAREDYSLPYENSNGHATAAAYLNGHYYLSPGFSTGNSGGWGSHNRVIDVDVVVGSAAETASLPAGAIWGIGNVSANGKVYFFGGWTGSPRSHILELDPVLGTLTQVGNMLRPTNEVVPTLGSDGWIYYWGRLHSGAPIERFDPISRQVQAMDSRLPIQTNAHPAYFRWHLPSEGTIYITEPRATIAGTPSPLYAFSYLSDTIVDTGATVPSEVINMRSIRDELDPNTVYGYLVSEDFWYLPHHLARLRLAPTNSAPVANAGPDQQLVAEEDCRARAQLDGSGSFDPDGDPLSYEWSASIGSFSGVAPIISLEPGTHIFSLIVSDAQTISGADAVEISVFDAAPPTILETAAAPSLLWPPNHKMVSVNISTSAVDSCGGSVTCGIVEVSSSEPAEGTGDGDTSPDWQIVDANTVLLRAERAGNGPGRTYSIRSACSDGVGNESSAVATVFVPHSRNH